MKRRLLIPVLVFSLGLNIGLAVQLLTPRVSHPKTIEPNEIQKEDGLGPRRAPARTRQGPPSMRQIVDELGLEKSERRRRFFEVKRTFFRHTAQQRQKVRSLQEELAAALTRPGDDPADLDDVLDRLTVAHGDLERLFVEHYQATLRLLEPDEQQIYRRHISEQIRPGPFRQRGDRP